MSVIRILPEILSNKIAAGEVVERPASVVKELIENSLDARTSHIFVEVEKGGRSLIRISDNGVGMNQDDAILAIERYATSKVYTETDLFSIRTLGFRGEAMPSIAAVSDFTLETRDAASESGTRIVVRGGKIKDVAEIGAPVGTLITIRQLFFNTPARRKFLKTVNTEMGHITDTVARIALNRHEVQFRMLHNGKIIRHWTAVNHPLDRVADVLGKDMKPNLWEIPPFELEGISVSGWAGDSRMTRNTANSIYIYVNGRFVRDKIIRHALFKGYGGRLMKGQFPVAVIFLALPADEVDVNVHPTKHEVRFVRQNKVHQAVAAAISETVKVFDRSFAVSHSPSEKISVKTDYMKSSARNPFEQKELQVAESHTDVSSRSHFHSQSPAFSPARERGKNPKNNSTKIDNHKNTLKNKDFYTQSPREKFRSDLTTGSKDVKKNNMVEIHSTNGNQMLFGESRVMGQLHRTYIVCETKDGVILVDQHAAHERILFEHLKKQRTGVSERVQQMLIPETIDLSHTEAVILVQLIPELKETGFDIEPFGGNTFVVKSVPAIMGNKYVTPLITAMVEKMAEITKGDTSFPGSVEKAVDECLIIMACHGAIRAGQFLSDLEMKDLLIRLDECDNPSHCPHGRPTWIKWTTSFLEKSFHRVV